MSSRASTVVVFDTVIFVRALINPESRWAKLIHTYGGAYRLVTSAATLREVVTVLGRAEMRKKFPRIGELEVAAVLRLLGQAELIEPVSTEQVARDPKDNPFLALARAAGADYLVTEDNDLLTLHSYHGTRIVTGREFHQIMQEQAA